MNVAAARVGGPVDGTGQTIGILSDSFDTDAGARHARRDRRRVGRSSRARQSVRLHDAGHRAVGLRGRRADRRRSGDGRARARSRAGCASRVRDRGERRARLRESDQPAANGEPRDRASSTTSTYFDEPFFQDGPIAEAANAASAAGVPYFSAAGNSNVIVGGNNVSSYEAPAFRSTACPASVIVARAAHGLPQLRPERRNRQLRRRSRSRPAADSGSTCSGRSRGARSRPTTTCSCSTRPATVVADSASTRSKFNEPFEFLGYTNSTGSTQTVSVVIGKFSGADRSAAEVRARRCVGDHRGAVRHVDRR